MIAWLAKNAINTDGSIKRNETVAYTAIFAQSTGSRLGTAVMLARIIPVEYSPVITSTPSTPIASCERLTPARAMSSGWRSACSCGLIEPQCDDVSAPKRHGRPIVNSTATKKHQRVERSERSLVHSETMTRAWVTFPVCARRGSELITGDVLTPRALHLRARRHGTRHRRGSA